MGGMSFLSPLFLLGALAVAVPIVLHLFRRRTEVVVRFSGGRLLAARAGGAAAAPPAARADAAGAARRRAGAAGRVRSRGPYFAGRRRAADAAVTVIAVDTSMSMSAPGAVRSRARRLAIEAVDDGAGSHALALVAFDDAATVIVQPTTDRGGDHGRASRRWRRATAARASGTALARAARCSARATVRVVIVTDLQQAGWEGNDARRVCRTTWT